MEQSTLASYQWTEGGIFIRKIESVLSSSKNPDAPSIEDWQARLLDHQHRLRSASILARATVILSEAPFRTMDTLLADAELGFTNDLSRIRAGRKLFHIARDGIILTTYPHNTPQYDSLRQLCRTLGVYADSNGEDTAAAQEAREALSELRVAPHESFGALHDTSLLISKIDRSVQGSATMTPEMAADISYGDFHQARKDFRRVSNVLTLEAAHAGDPDLIQLATDGIRLNRHFGRIADTLDKTAP